ncbi:uncharacterized protein LOC127003685 isoform X2 [Eriocheir sinensis]|uniref:uncharacterized protein LOC127003685 isoform X2 n=1 Tax=Eriocheir sinensis TaxID=95602 RepID=UPI0021C6DB0D|nr:uncharacterized protein LOC127003685 isoform X2 [Eriocheir sinensis]
MARVGVQRKPRQLQIVTPEEELENLKNEATLSDPGRSAMLSVGDGTSLAQLLCQAKEESRALRQEAAELRCRLHDAQADTKVLREEVQRWRGGGEGRRGSQANTALTQLALQERERFISQMEELSAKCQALEGDVRGLVEEREELVRELDATHHKLHRLNYILNTILSSPHYTTTTTTNTSTATPTPPKRIVDLDAIITENRYLQQRLKQAEEDVALARSNSAKYKSALERCRTQGSFKLGTSENLIVTPKQVSELLQEYRGEMGGSAENDLRSLCVALVDALGQRSRALRTQRSANRVLVDRVNELERRLVDNSGQGGQTGDAAPLTDLPLAARELMEGYTPPAGIGGLSYVKEEDASRDPRLAKFLGPLTAPQPPSHTRDAGDGEVQMNGVNGNEINVIAETERESVDLNLTHVHSGMSVDEISSSEEEIEENDLQEEDERDMKESSPLLPNLQCSQASADDTLEEIVPLDQLDAYIKEMHLNRRCTATQKGRKETKKGKEEEEKKREKKGKEEEKRCGKERKEREVEKEVVERGRTETEMQKRVDKRERKEIRSQREADGKKSAGTEAQEETAGTKEQREVERTQENNTSTAGKETKMTADSSTTSVDRTEAQEETAGTKEPREAENNALTTEMTADSSTTSVDDLDKKINEKDYDESFDEETNITANSFTTSVDDIDDKKDYDDDESFDLDLSDYDSDNDKLDLALEEWRNDCGGGKLVGEPSSPAKGRKKERFRLWRKEPKDSGDDVELPSALQALLDKAAASVDTSGDGNAGWTM